MSYLNVHLTIICFSDPCAYPQLRQVLLILIGNGKHLSMDNTKIGIKRRNFTEQMKRSPDERHKRKKRAHRNLKDRHSFIDVITSIKSMKCWLHLRKSVKLRLPSRLACEVVQGIPGRWQECRLYKG